MIHEQKQIYWFASGAQVVVPTPYLLTRTGQLALYRQRHIADILTRLLYAARTR